MDIYEKKGYLKDNFKIFHLTDNGKREFEFHYHDFYKVLIFLRGKVNYCIEGKTYALAPYDIVLVGEGEIHRPVVLDDSDYERIIAYISPEFLKNSGGVDLRLCFESVREHDSNVVRIPAVRSGEIRDLCLQLETAVEDKEFGFELLTDIKFLEFMIKLNRAVLNRNTEYIPKSANSKIQEITRYINDNIKEELDIDTISNHFYISRYHLMHMFKAGTGCTVHSYITQKRLLCARALIQSGKSITEACYDSGFKNYDSFLRSYKKSFGTTPKHN